MFRLLESDAATSITQSIREASEGLVLHVPLYDLIYFNLNFLKLND